MVQTFTDLMASLRSYNPDEPRDNDGKWTGGGGDVAAVEPKEQFAGGNNPDGSTVVRPDGSRVGGPPLAWLHGLKERNDFNGVTPGSYKSQIDDTKTPTPGGVPYAEVQQINHAWQRPANAGMQADAVKQALANLAGGIEHIDPASTKDPGWTQAVSDATAVVAADRASVQTYYKENNISAVELTRGIFFPAGTPLPAGFESVGVKPPGQWEERILAHDAVSSWTNSYKVATDFARNKWGTSGHAGDGSPEKSGTGFIISAQIPVERIVDNSYGGLGALVLGEHIVIGNADFPVKITRVS